MSVFVLDRRKNPLMPCSEKRARLLLTQKRAIIHRVVPFTIRLKDRQVPESVVQPVALKLDPGSKVTGMVLVRVQQTPDGEIHHALHLAHLEHRGEAVHEAMGKRARYRRRRRSANLRYRAPRFLNRRRPTGWLPPSLHSRVGNVLTWARRYQRWVPLQRIEVERVKFDLTLIQHPEVSGVEYQRGELLGWEIRCYLLQKYQRRCVYCGASNQPFELDHVQPRSRGGPDRVSNLVLACHDCNRRKGKQTAREFGHLEVEAQVRQPLRDAAAVNTTRFALVEALRVLGLPIGTWSGGRTRWNRDRLGVRKDHALDALCVGQMAGVDAGRNRRMQITAQGRGRYGRTLVDRYGFARGFLLRQKRVKGFATGDLVQASVPESLQTRGSHQGRVAVRATGSFRVGTVDGINVKYCRLLQRSDGYEVTLLTRAEGPSPLKKERLFPPHV